MNKEEYVKLVNKYIPEDKREIFIKEYNNDLSAGYMTIIFDYMYIMGNCKDVIIKAGEYLSLNKSSNIDICIFPVFDGYNIIKLNELSKDKLIEKYNTIKNKFIMIDIHIDLGSNNIVTIIKPDIDYIINNYDDNLINLKSGIRIVGIDFLYI